MTFGYTCLGLGIAFCLIGVFWHFPRVTRTTGVVVESTAPAGGQAVRVVTYDYIAYGVHHRGQRFLRYGRQYPGMFEVGASFPVYFVSAHPDESYAPFPPRITLLIVSGVMLAALGGTVIFFAWRA
jgi:hypothetical protein